MSRDSDTSFCSSRPSSSSVGMGRSNSNVPINDRSYQVSAIRTINAYLSSHHTANPNLSLKHPLPSAKDVTDTLHFLLTRLHFPAPKLEQDLPVVLKQLNCPIKLNKSALRAPGTPHAWPSLLAVIHWLVQIAMYNDHLSLTTTSFLNYNATLNYALESYLHFIRGDDESVDALDREFSEKLEEERESADQNVKSLGQEILSLEGKVESLRLEPSAKEVLEKEKCVLEEDERKFNSLIEQLTGAIAMVDKSLEEKEKEVDAKVLENKKILEENEELKKMVESQTFNARDAERMKRELQAVERDIAEAEIARNAWEEKSWDLDATLGHKLKDLEALSIECNQAMRRLKLGNTFQYTLNAKGSTPAEVLGIDYKSTLKPLLDSFSDDIKKSSMVKLEELISLQQESVDLAAKIEAKRNRIALLQTHIDEVEAQLDLLKKDTQDFTSRCAAEAKKMADDVEAEARHLDNVEKEAADMLQNSQLKFQEAVRQNEEEIQLCACELFQLVDSVSKYKEFMATRITEMKTDLSETAGTIADAYKGQLPAQFRAILEASH